MSPPSSNPDPVRDDRDPAAPGPVAGSAVDAVSGDLGALVAEEVEAAGLELYDLHRSAGTVRVTVTRAGGVDLDTITALTRQLIRAIDASGIPRRFHLEVSSPGLERELRTPAHHRGAVGERVRVKTVPGREPRRIEGVLRDADAEGIEIETDRGTVRLAYTELERSRTTFDWSDVSGRGAGTGGPSPRRRHHMRGAHEQP